MKTGRSKHEGRTAVNMKNSPSEPWMSMLLNAKTSHQLSKALRIAQKSLLPVRLHHQQIPEPHYQKLDLPCQQIYFRIQISPCDIPEVEYRSIIAQISNEKAADGQGKEVMCHYYVRCDILQAIPGSATTPYTSRCIVGPACKESSDTL